MKIFRSGNESDLGRASKRAAIMPAKTILSMATEKGQQCLGGQDGVDGFLKKGARADIVGIDRSRIYMAEYGKISNTIMESVNAGDIRDSVSGGRIFDERLRDTDTG